MHPTPARALLYGSAVAIAGALGAAVAFGEAEADVDTLLSSVDVQLRLAWSMPAHDRDGRALPAREELIAEAERHLDSIERRESGRACAAEFRGFAHMLRGDHVRAAEAYARARSCADCEAEQHDVLAFNEARMLARAGRGDAALAVFAQHATALDTRFGHQRAIEEAAILRTLDRRVEAQSRLETVVADDRASPMAWLQAGLELEQLGLPERADAAFARAADSAPIADFHRARLKLRAGAVDTAFELLGRAEKAAPAEVRRLVRSEPDAWRELADDARFQQLLSRPAAPGR